MSLPWISFLPMSAVMLAGWFWQQKYGKAAIVDILWAILMGGFGLWYAVTGQAQWPVSVFVAALMAIWYWSLAWHLLRRMRREGEDGRYRYLREHWGARAGIGYFVFFQIQAGFAWAFTLPAWFITHHTGTVAAWQLLSAVVLVVVAWSGERLADAQLATFKRNAQSGQVCREGLWRYSRHPNYFFEWLQWLVWPLLGWQYSGGAWLLLAPLVMWLFLYFITGIRYAEEQSIRSRGDIYREYQRTTSAFIPWRPKV